jgi:antitoxin ParD1/3/4
MNVSLTPELEKLVKQEVDSGLYNNASEVIRDALRLLKERKDTHRAKLKKLRAALAEGEAAYGSGDFTRLDGDKEIDAFFAKL